jgi:excinuclease ABC subunit C
MSICRRKNSKEDFEVGWQNIPLRKCKRIYLDKCKKPCLQYHLGYCLAPCCMDVNKQEYKNIVENMKMFLKWRLYKTAKRMA